MEKIPIAKTWQDEVLAIYNQIPESEEPDMVVMDKALEGILQIMTMLGDKIAEQEGDIKRLERLVTQLDISKELLEGNKATNSVPKVTASMYL